jgi:hypothetical protein
MRERLAQDLDTALGVVAAIDRKRGSIILRRP